MTVGLLPQIIYSPNDDAGLSAPGSRLAFYEAGSTTVFKAIFSDFASTPLANPVFADGNGRFPQIVLDDGGGLYNVQFSLSDGATIPTYTQKWFIDLVGFAGSDPLLLGDGTAADPTYSFASETGTGIFLAGSGLLAASVLGNEVVQWTAQGLNIATSGESATPSLYLEGDIDTGWRQDGVNNWTFSATGQDQLSLSLGMMSLPGPTGANNNFTIGAKATFASVFSMAGDDITQPMTSITGTNNWLSLTALSGTGGGVNLTGLSDTDLEGIVIRGFIGSAAPATSTAAIELRAGKSDGGTGVTNLASTELAFSVADSSGANLFSVLGDGSLPDVDITSGTAVLDNLGIGNAINSGWLTGDVFQISNSSIFADASSNNMSQNAYFDGINWRYITTAPAANYFQSNNTQEWRIAPSGTADTIITWTTVQSINSTGEHSLFLPSSPGTAGTLYNNSGVVTVA